MKRFAADMGWTLSLSLLAGAAAILAVAAMVPLVAAVQVHGPWISHELDYVAGVAGALIIGAFLLAWPVRERDSRALFLIWLAKAGVALGPMLYYEAHYAFLDAFAYHEDARRHQYLLQDAGWGRGTENLTLLLQGLYLVLPGSYHLAKVIFAFIGLIGIYLAYRGAQTAWGGGSVRPLYVLGLFPGLLFWSSILGKEALMILAAGLFVYGAGNFRSAHRRLRGVGAVLLGVVLAATLRIWMMYLLLAAFLVFVLLERSIGRAGRCAAVALVLALALLFREPAADLLGFESGDVVAQLGSLSSAWAEGGSAQQPPEFDRAGDIVAFVPVGAFTALFRPLPGEVPSLFGLLAGIESVALLALAFVALSRLDRRNLRDSFLVALASLVAMWAVVYGVVSYQNLGTAARFRAQILPVLLLVSMFPWWRSPFRERLLLLRAVPLGGTAMRASSRGAPDSSTS
ncbi:MAG TPA: hypothetical protein VF203_07340 [Burkholderiales bacterium]